MTDKRTDLITTFSSILLNAIQATNDRRDFLKQFTPTPDQLDILYNFLIFSFKDVCESAYNFLENGVQADQLTQLCACSLVGASQRLEIWMPITDPNNPYKNYMALVSNSGFTKETATEILRNQAIIEKLREELFLRWCMTHEQGPFGMAKIIEERKAS